jgi:hypothetical protein
MILGFIIGLIVTVFIFAFAFYLVITDIENGE